MIVYLSQEKILQQEITLLSAEGPSLCSFYVQEPVCIFQQPCEETQISLQQNYRIINAKTGRSPNICYHVISMCLFSKSDEIGKNKDFIEKFKLTFLGKQFQILKIPQCCNLTNIQMKKILVEFLQILSYTSTELQEILNRYAIVSQVLSAFYQTLHPNSKSSIIETVTNILDYFDFPFIMRKNIISLQNSLYVILVDQNKVYLGERTRDLSTKTSNMNLQHSESSSVQLKIDPFDQQIINPQINKKDNVFVNPETPFFAEVSWQDATKLKFSQNQIRDSKENLRSKSAEWNEKTKLQQKEIKKETQYFKLMLNMNEAKKNKSTEVLDQKMTSKQRLNEIWKCKKCSRKSIRSQNVIKDTSQSKQKSQKIALSQFCIGRSKKIKLQSAVFRVKIESKLKNKISNQVSRSFGGSNGTKNPPLGSKFSKIPDFLLKKQIIPQKNPPKTYLNQSYQHPPKPVMKPRVTFTYISPLKVSNQSPSQSTVIKYRTQPTHIDPGFFSYRKKPLCLNRYPK